MVGVCLCVEHLRSEWVEGKWEAKGAPGNPRGLTGCPLRVLGLVQQAGLAGSEACSEEAETAEDAMHFTTSATWKASTDI